MDLSLDFIQKLLPPITLVTALFVLYRTLVSNKDAVIELHKERCKKLECELTEARHSLPDSLAKSLSERVQIMDYEIECLMKDKEAEKIKSTKELAKIKNDAESGIATAHINLEQKENELKRIQNELILLNNSRTTIKYFIDNTAYEAFAYLEGVDGLTNYIKKHVATDDDCISTALDALKQNTLKFRIFAEKLSQSVSDYKIEMHSFQSCLDKAIYFYRNKAKGKAITFSISGEFPILPISHTHIEHALYHLLENAIQYSNHGYNSPAQIKISGNIVNHNFELDIHNCGLGIDNDEFERIFEPRYQSRNIKDANRIGVGGGLAIVQSIITGHDGEIWAESSPLQTNLHETIFHVRLPMMQQ